ncbi:MAG: DUF3857 and transglutaminase domain-containing protein [Smithellaceae bacterium]
MKKTKLLLWIFIFFSFSCASTPAPFKSVTGGNVNNFLANTPKASDHPNAGASLLSSHVYVEYFEDGTSVTRHLERYKIFNERGRRHVSKTISYREGYQQARILFANTITPDGRVMALSPREVYEASQYAGYDFYTDIKLKRFTMPGVEDGCVVEYAYEIKNIKPVFGFDYSTIFLNQNLYPMEEDILEIIIPADKEVLYKSFNTTLTPQILTEGNKKKYTIANSRQNAIIPEPRMPGLMDRETFPQIRIWTMRDWRSISSWYIQLMREQMKSDHDLDVFTRELISDKKTNEEKIGAIFDFVSRNIRYVAVLLGPHTHKPHPAREVFQKRYGDCKDKTVLLLTMLKIAGIEALPALVPAQREYFDENMPSIYAFNHVIAAVPREDGFYWLDATNDVAAFDSPPFFQPITVFLIQSDGSYRFVQTPAPDEKKDYSETEITFRIDEAGDAKIILYYSYHGKAAEPVRFAYKYMPPEQRKTSFEKRGIEVEKLEMGSFNDTRNPFFVRLSGRVNNRAQVVNSDTMILSNILRFDTYRDITASTTRHYPLVLHPSFYSLETFRYVFPDGFRVKNLPVPFSSDYPLNNRKETFVNRGSTLEISVETLSRKRKIIRGEMNLFRAYALELQRHESALKNIILERSQ